MGNIALNKNADASSYVNPFIAARGVNGVTTPIGRWIGSSPLPPGGAPPQPVWMRVDLGAACWINRWVVKQMGSVGWSANYNLTDYKFQGSLDNANWFDLDSVNNNSANSTDRTFTPSKARWVRVYITKGIRGDTNFASIAELEVYDIPTTDSTLSALTLNNGTTTVPSEPTFVKTTTTYTASVNYDTAKIAVTATATDSRATIKVNGVPVQQGQASQWIDLTAGGVTPVNVVVTPYIGDPQTYTVNVTRASSPYLSGLVVKSGKATLTLSPPFNRNTFAYTASTSASTSALVTATTEDSGAAIRIKGNPATSGVALTVPVNSGSNPIDIIVSSGVGTDQKTYLCTLTVGT
jgi:hypothetical protein